MKTYLGPMMPILNEVLDMTSGINMVIRMHYDNTMEQLKISGSNQQVIDMFFQLEADIKTLDKLTSCLKSILPA